MEQKRQLPREGMKLLLWDAFPARVTVHPSRTASGLKTIAPKMQVAELYNSQFLPDPKTDLAFPFLSVIFHPYLSFQPQAWLQLFRISETLDYLSDLNSRSGISRGPGTTSYLKPGYMEMLRSTCRIFQVPQAVNYRTLQSEATRLA